MKAFEHPPRTTRVAKRQMAAMLWLLHLNGPVVDPSGGAVRKLLKRLNDAGIDVSVNGVKRMINSLCEGGDYPYDYVERIVKGKHTKRIALIVDPREVPFPENPFKDNPRFKSANGNGNEVDAMPPARTDLPEAPGETFARQAAFEAYALPAPPPPTARAPEPELEPEPEREPQLLLEEAEPEHEPGPEPESQPVALERYELPTQVRTNGDDHELDGDDLFDLPEDLLDDIDRFEGRRSTDLVSQAIGLLGAALAAIGTEQLDLVTVGLGQQIDERLGKYMRQIERADKAEDQLRHVVQQYERVVALARAQRKENVALKRRLAAVNA